MIRLNINAYAGISELRLLAKKILTIANTVSESFVRDARQYITAQISANIMPTAEASRKSTVK